jgi:hydroxylamine reductase
MKKMWAANEDIRCLKSLILFGIRGVAAYAYHAWVLGYTDESINNFFFKALFAIGMDDFGMDELLPIVLEVGEVNLRCMALLDRANTETYGNPVPTEVNLTVEKGPFIVISGHDLYDLKQLLEQTEGKGVNIYTHGEMLPAHAYPELKKYPHLKGNFGTAWQNQQKEFADIPAPILFTTNCLMPPRASYADRVFTTEVVSYPEIVHIGENKDFTPVIEKALVLGGYSDDMRFTGVNGGEKVMTGFAHNAVLSVADTLIDAVKSGAIKHFFLVGGCDGAKPGRNYYTEFVKQTPSDSVVLTLACGKYRFNDLDLGMIGGLPRLMDMGQCNDAYSAIKVAVALAEAFGCGVNDLPLSMVLSWYEQKAVCILLTLLHLGIKNILLGPSLPAFVSSGVLNFLVQHYNITPITTPEDDLKRILG